MTGAVFILGAGRAGRGLSRALGALGIDVAGLHGRRIEQTPDAITAGPLPPAVGTADVILVAVRDGQLENAFGILAAAPLRPAAVILHASGSAEPAGLPRLRAQGHACGTFHPLVPLADPARAAALLRGAWIGIDGDPAAVATAVELAQRLGAHALRIPRGEKATYHAAAVFASNFATVLASVAAELLTGIGVDGAEAWGAIGALMRGAITNLEGTTAAAALTGPIVRGDVATINAHLAALRSEPAARRLYVALSTAAVELARRAGTDAATLGKISAVLEA